MAISAQIELIKTIRAKAKHAIFCSFGDREKFATYSLKNLSNEFDLIFFYYGSNGEKLKEFKDNTRIFAWGRGSKFNALKMLTDHVPGCLDEYETVWVCDDDLIVTSGDLHLLPKILMNFGLLVISPAHDPRGAISWQIMKPRSSNLFRYVNFVETTCPMFRAKALISFLKSYDGNLQGWGIDWWYMNHFCGNIRPIGGVCDQVIVLNPTESQKEGGYREIEKLASNDLRLRLWREAQKRHQLKQWKTRSLFSVSPWHD